MASSKAVFEKVVLEYDKEWKGGELAEHEIQCKLWNPEDAFQVQLEDFTNKRKFQSAKSLNTGVECATVLP